MRRLLARGLGDHSRAMPAAVSFFPAGAMRRGLRAAQAMAFVALLGVNGCRAQRPAWPLWETYTARFLDQQGRVIDHNAQDRTTTEGEAYAMFFALVANDQPRFDKLVDWTENNMAQGDLTLHLPAWSWGKAPDGSWRVLDPNPAADADLWMAYSLCEAGRLWNIDRYAKLGHLMADRIAQEEVVLVPGVGTTMIPGAKGFHPDADTWFLNPSYLPPEIIAYFAHRDSHSPWRQVLESLPKVVTSQGGFAMDWMKAGLDGAHPSATPEADEDASQKNQSGAPAHGSYDAIRVYLWLGMADPKTPGVHDSLAALPGMARWLQSHPAPPLSVDDEGHSTQPDSPPGFSAAVIPYLHVLGLQALEERQSERLGATKDLKSGLYGHEGWYYDQNLALFSTGWSEHRFRFNEEGRLVVKWK
jgi:endo-1,4-beta-D-glucanase Y